MSHRRIQPMREKLLISKDPGRERLGSLFLPEAARKPQTTGVVIATGPGFFAGYDEAGEPVYTPTEYHEGDRVVFGEWAGCEIRVDGETYFLLTPDEIHARLV